MVWLMDISIKWVIDHPFSCGGNHWLDVFSAAAGVDQLTGFEATLIWAGYLATMFLLLVVPEHFTRHGRDHA